MVCVAFDCKLEVAPVIRVSVQDNTQIDRSLQVLEDPEEEVAALAVPAVIPPGDLRDSGTKVRAGATANPQKASAVLGPMTSDQAH